MESFSATDFEINQYLFQNISEYNILDTYTLGKYPIVYIIYDTKSKIAYVGESTNAIHRMQNHLAHPEKRKLKYLYIISSEKFNKSATLDLESYLIEYMVGDKTFELLNGNGGLIDHNYYQKDLYKQLFANVWTSLKLQKIVVKDILEINNSDLFKYSPYKALTQDQLNAVYNYLKVIVGKKESCVFVQGSAGTGKTIVAIYIIKLLTTKIDIDDFNESEGLHREVFLLVKKIQDSYDDLKIALVVPMTSLRMTLKKVFKNIKGLKGSMVINAPDSTKKKFDILLVDEAHRLKRRKNLSGYGAFDNTNKRLGLGKNGTELDWIRMHSKHQLFFYDSEQSIKPTDVPQTTFTSLKNDEQSFTIELTSQLRAKGGQDYIKFIDRLLNQRLGNNYEKFSHDNYDLKLYTSIDQMIVDMKVKENEYGLCRMMAGYGWKWHTNPKIKRKEGEVIPTFDADIDGVKFIWNKNSNDWINSTTDMNEIGCIHTVQGYDLNYAGVILGNEIRYDKVHDKIYTVKANYYDAKGSGGLKDGEVLHNYIINIYKTMLYRGILGTYIYVCDYNLREYLRKYIHTI